MASNKLDAKAGVYRLTGPLLRQVPGIDLFLVLEGSITLRAGKKTQFIEKGSIYAIGQCELLRIMPCGKECTVLVLTVPAEFVYFAYNGLFPAFDFSRKTGGDALKGMLAEIAYSSTREKDRLLFESRVFMILRELSRVFPAKEAEGGEDNRKERIAAYLSKRFRDPVSLGDMAEELSLSIQHLSRYFRQSFGVTFHAYLSGLRIESAMKALSFTDDTVTAIAYDNGFPNLSSFLKELKAKTGKTPSEYRREYKNLRAKKDSFSAQEAKIEESPDIIKKLKPYLRESVHEQRTVTVDVAQWEPYARPWAECINLCFANDFFKSPYLEQIKKLQEETPFRYGRFQGIFSKSMNIVNRENRTYNFVQADKIIDFLLSVKLIPFIELGMKPNMIARRLNDRVYFTDDDMAKFTLDDYDALVGGLLRHLVNRYGIDEIGRWRFELWAPTGEKTRYEQREVEEYVERFVRIRRIIKEISPASLVGGPGFNLVNIEYPDLLGRMFCALKGRDSLPDFVSFYAYSFHPVPLEDKHSQDDDMLILWEKDETIKRIVRARDFILSQNQGIRHFFVTEWNLDFSCRNRLHDSLLKASFILQNSIDAIGEVDALSHWMASDISAEYSDTGAFLFGGAGVISQHGLKKPSFFSYLFLSFLGSRLLARGPGYIVTASTEKQISAIVFNYKYIGSIWRRHGEFHDLSRDPEEFLEDRAPLTILLNIRNIHPGRYKVRQHILNAAHGSIYNAWKRLSSIPDLQRSEELWLGQSCVPDLRIDFLRCEDTFSLECTLEANEVRLLEISLMLE